MKVDKRNVYCFRLTFTDNTCFFYRVIANNKEHAYMKMIKELTHETNVLRSHHLNTVSHIYTIVDHGNTDIFVRELNKAAAKYYKFVHNYKFGALQQYYYLNTHCIHCDYNDTCVLNKRTCKMEKGYYCSEYTKGR